MCLQSFLQNNLLVAIAQGSIVKNNLSLPASSFFNAAGFD